MAGDSWSFDLSDTYDDYPPDGWAVSLALRAETGGTSELRAVSDTGASWLVEWSSAETTVFASGAWLWTIRATATGGRWRP